MIKTGKTIIGFWGIGAFCVLIISSLAFLIKGILRDICLFLDVVPGLNFWATELLTLLIFGVITLFTIRWILSKIESINKNILRMLILFIGIFFLSQILQSFYAFYGTGYIIEHCFESFNRYNDFVNEKIFYHSFSGLTTFLEYLLFGLIVYLKVKREII